MLLKRRLVWIVLLASVALACVVCMAVLWYDTEPGETDLSLTPLASIPTLTRVSLTPTPHYTPMSGEVYAVSNAPGALLYETPGPVLYIKDVVTPNIRVEILQPLWVYTQGNYGDRACYMYQIRVPGTQIEGWIDQEDLFPEKGKRVFYDYWCAQGGLPTPTPSYLPLSGPAYVNVGEGYGAAGSYLGDPRVNIGAVFAHGVQVYIYNKFWFYDQEYGISCYVYHFMYRIGTSPESSAIRMSLPEDVLSVDLAATPRAACFPSGTPPAVLELSSALSAGYRVITPEAY